MDVELLKRIRSELGLNPSSKSTLVTKPQLLTYASMLHEQCSHLQALLQPYDPKEHAQIQEQIQHKTISLGSCESSLKEARKRNQVLSLSIARQREFISQAQQVLQAHQNSIQDLELRLSGKSARNMELSASQTEGEGDRAIKVLMREFVSFREEQE